MNLRILLPLIFLLLVGSTMYAQDPQPDPAAQPFGPVQTLSSQPDSTNIQSVDPSGAGRPDVFNPPADYVAPPAKKTDEVPGDAPLLVPIEPATNVPFSTAEYRSEQIPYQQFPTSTAVTHLQ